VNIEKVNTARFMGKVYKEMSHKPKKAKNWKKAFVITTTSSILSSTLLIDLDFNLFNYFLLYGVFNHRNILMNQSY